VLRWQQGAWTLTPKSALLRPAAASYRTIEWRLRDSTTTVVTPAAPSQNLAAYAKSYPRQLRRHSQRLLEAWPLPWLALSLAGLWRARRATWLAPLALLLVYPLLDAPDEIRFSQFFVPTLALLAACGAETIADRGRWARALLAALALGGLVWVWAGPAGLRARKFDDGPMPELRGAGAWLRAHAPKDAIVMDRKSFVPFFAGLEHAQLPNDSLAAIADYARRSGASYLVAEEYVARALRPQLRELLTVPDSAEARYGLRLCYAARTKPGWGVAVFEVSK
jgi:hypothetical protein